MNTGAPPRYLGQSRVIKFQAGHGVRGCGESGGVERYFEEEAVREFAGMLRFGILTDVVCPKNEKHLPLP